MLKRTGAQRNSNIFASTPRKEVCENVQDESTPRKEGPKKQLFGALSLLTCYDSDSQQSMINDCMPETDKGLPEIATADHFNLAALNESLDISLNESGVETEPHSGENNISKLGQANPEQEVFNMSQLSESLNETLELQAASEGDNVEVNNNNFIKAKSSTIPGEIEDNSSTRTIRVSIPEGSDDNSSTSTIRVSILEGSEDNSSTSTIRVSTLEETEDSLTTTASVTFLGESNEQLQDEVLSAIDVTAGDALVLPLGNELASLNNDIVIEIVEPPAEPSHPKPRLRKTQQWKRNVEKQLYDSGCAHVTSRGKQKEERKIGVGCTDTCKRKCHHNIPECDREKIFNNFWAISNHTMQWYYIASQVKTVDVKRRTVHDDYDYSRKYTYLYQLPSATGLATQVCQKFFLDTLGISQKWVRSALMKQRTNHGTVPQDKRGKHKKMTPARAAIRRGIIEHIMSFPTVEGHYTRKGSKSKYLAENLNKRIMYSLYKIQQEAANETKYGSLRQYRDVFKTEFNLKFFRPKKDQCARCLSWKNKTPQEKTEEELKKYERHLSNKETSNELKRQDVELVKKDEEIRKTTCVLSCDLQKVLQCPKGMNRDFFFASKVSVYNFTVFVSGDQQGINFVWDQTEARRGAAEIGSCMWLVITKKAENGVVKIVIYSDNCSSQNKNQYLFSMYMLAALKYGITIIHRYLEVGHTHMEVDSVHARIELATKHTDIFVPNQWFTAIRTAKKTRPYYEVHELSQNEIFDFSPLAAHFDWEKLKTSTFREIIVSGDEQPGTVIYKTDYKEEAIKTNVLKKTPGRPVNWKTFSLKKKYTAKIPLPSHTLKSCQDMCKSGSIPSFYAPYYMETLPSYNQRAAPPQPATEEVSDIEDSNDSESDESESDAAESEEDSED